MLFNWTADLVVWTDRCEPTAPYLEVQLVLKGVYSGGKTIKDMDVSKTTATGVIIHLFVASIMDLPFF